MRLQLMRSIRARWSKTGFPNMPIFTKPRKSVPAAKSAPALSSVDVEIGARCLIEPNVVIGKGVVIGNDCRVGACTSISHAIIGNRVAIYPGARIGQDGFGYALSDRGISKCRSLAA